MTHNPIPRLSGDDMRPINGPCCDGAALTTKPDMKRQEAIPMRRRDLLAGAGVLAVGLAISDEGRAVAAAPVPAVPAHDSPQPAVAEALLTLTATEQAFLIAFVDLLVPADSLSPSASECGVVTFIDRQLAGAWGAGARLYRSGPFLKGKPEHGYQLPLTPREYFAVGIAAVNHWTGATHGGPLDVLGEADRAAVLGA